MRRYCGCGRPIWIVERPAAARNRLIFYDDGEANVWMPIAACPCCGASLDAATLHNFSSTPLRLLMEGELSEALVE
ncbi:MAG: hypothetical protein ABI274_14260 [Ktedonobacterales bacterium]